MKHEAYKQQRGITKPCDPPGRFAGKCIHCGHMAPAAQRYLRELARKLDGRK